MANMQLDPNDAETLLPLGMTEFEEWADKIIAIVGPLADRDSMKYVLASNILALKPNQDAISLNEMARLLRKAAANQIASAVFQQVREKQKAAQAEAEKQQQPAEVTASPETAAADGKKD